MSAPRMLRSRTLGAVGVALVIGGALGGAGTAGGQDPKAAPAPSPSGGHQHGGAQGHDHHDDAVGHGQGHVHAPVPPEYAAAHVPAAAWTEPRMITRGKDIYMIRCAVCHGENGDGKGPAGVALPLKPPDLRDSKMMSEMTGNYWFWRVSEGGAIEPFKSMGSAMPAWKDALSVEDRWAVIVYQHTFSGHAGPHVVSEHAGLGMAGQAGHSSGSTGDAAAPAPRGSGHKH